MGLSALRPLKAHFRLKYNDLIMYLSSLTNAGKFVGAVIGGVIQAVLHEHSGFSSIRRPPYINDLPFPSLINYDDDETDSNDPFDVEN